MSNIFLCANQHIRINEYCREEVVLSILIADTPKCEGT